jgi:peptidoglycan-associated lipoprotein
MRLRIRYKLALLLTVAAVSTMPILAQAASGQPSTTDPKPYRAEIAGGYTYIHSNAPPGGCGCFNLNGGNGTFAWLLPSASSVKLGSFALVGDVTVAHAGSVSGTANTLTLSTFTAGGRYLPRLKNWPLQPFGQVLIGLAHSSGTLVQGTNPGAANGGASFASIFGGGADLRATPRISIRLIEADYLLTTVDNGSNNHQNNLRISTGIVFHFWTK